MEGTVMQEGARGNGRSGPLLRPQEAADVLGVGLSVVYRAVRAGQLPGVRIGRRLYLPRALVMKMLGVEEQVR
jgi:excisionase family DNA binding protein